MTLATSPRLMAWRAAIARRRWLSGGEVVALAHVAVLYVAAELALRVAGVRRAASWLGVSVTGPAGDRANRSVPISWAQSERRRIWAARRVSALLYGWDRGCLRQSLVLGRVLLRHNPTLRIGARRDGGQRLVAHAWIEIAGAPIETVGAFESFDPIT